MRTTLLARLVLVLVLTAVVGLPGVQQLAPTPAAAQLAEPGARPPMPAGDVWTGDVPGAPAIGERSTAPTPSVRSGGGVDSASVGSAGTTDGSSVSSGSVPANPATRTDPTSADPTPAGTTPPVATGPTEPIIVRFKAGAGRNGQVDAHVRAGAVRARAVALTDAVVVDVPTGRGNAALAAYQARADVLYAEPDYTVQAYYTPNDPSYSSQWALTKVNAPAAWDVTRGSPTVRVAVVDCGVFSQQTGRTSSDGQAGHPDLRGRVIMNQDFTSSATGFDDYCDHGTHVAGIIGAAGNNGVGVSGLAPEVSLMNAKVLSDSGSGSTSNILNGVSWAVQNGAHVVNMSLGRDGACSQSESDMMNWAYSQGVVVVAAAGNSGLSASGSPANCPNVISVAATTSTDALASFSNRATNVDVAAPGSSILSTVRSGSYASYSGTSMASPYVAGLAGLIFSLDPNRTPASVISVIQSSSDAISGTGSQFAWGRINASRAVSGGGSPPPATSTSVATATPTRTPTPTQTAVPAPTQVACQSPRPMIVVTTTPAGGATFDVSVQAGAGVVRQLRFTQFRNVSVTIGSYTNVTQPFTYAPPTFGSQLGFRVSQLSAGQAGTVSLTVTDDCGPWYTLVGAGAGGFQRGAVAGTIRNAADNQPINGANLSVRGTSRQDQTDANGAYTITDVPVGTRMLDISAAGFATRSVQVNITANQTTTADITMTANGSSQNIVVSLTWGTSPGDLDIHLSGPTTSGSRFHLYWNNPSAVSHAVLSADQHNGYGPESVTIRRSALTNNWVPGEYRIWSHNYSGTPGYGGSSARVAVSRGGTELGSYDVANASGTSSQLLWRSVNLTVDTNGNVSLTPVQQFLSGTSGTILRFFDGDEQMEWPTTGKR